MRRVADAGLPRPTSPLFFLPIALGLALALPDTTRGQCQANELAKLTACDAAAGDEFGISVSISGDVAVIGARWDDDGGPVSGSAYVYRLNRATGDWEEEAKLTASDAAPSDEFGRSVSICNEVVVIGALFNDDGGSHSGSAYVFRFNGSGWVEEAKLTASDAAAFDWFGWSVSIRGDIAVIGARFDVDSDPRFDSGSVYVFKEPPGGWVDMTETAKLTASDAGSFDNFGFSVSISGDMAVMGAWHDDDVCPGDPPNCNSGSAYVFRGFSDCNDNGTLDLCDIADGTSTDANGNGVPDDCECLADLDGDSSVGILDLLALLAAWGSNPGHPADFNNDTTVGVLDLLTLLANWGPCA